MYDANPYAMDNESNTKAVVPGQRSSELPPGFNEMTDGLKSIARGAHVRGQPKVNTEMLQMYWEIGRTILARQREEKWGAKVVGRIAAELKAEFPAQRGVQHAEPSVHAADGSNLARTICATGCCAIAMGARRHPHVRLQNPP
ncbi:DUF1016 N-terminal domain-containing protein [Streptomyces sp. NPDC048295]|uniref:DUF1016 N-terminal domain-containing protein n=1 Tax=Streptomyces sp. NPDC048295 TaxID=3154617 RepID=UPI00343F0156